MDINCDLGESFGVWKMGNDAAIMPYITSANIACGFHAGDFTTMLDTISLCQKYGVNMGAHPSFPDLQGFGRRKMQMSASEVYALVLYQMGALDALIRVKGGKLHHVKPHGVLYNQAAEESEIADAIASAVKAFDSQLILYGLSGSKLIDKGKEKGLITRAEVFADRAYTQEGFLADRRLEGAVLTDEIRVKEQIACLVQGLPIHTIDKKTIRLDAETICIHGDGSRALEVAQWVKAVVQ
ncbi:MAG: 5-oxoprolinase subunit PxpA [Spirosomataceae bacterium]